ncbi:MAG: cache domain-containing protein, partial [Kangiellaceae bacterium]|nr:cache domain-containing protein [Kangiellaceae bacterium]
MFQDLSLRKKSLILIGATVAVLMLIAAYFLVDQIARQSRESIELQAKNYIAVESSNIESFFAQYGRVVDTFVNSAHIKKWFSNWNDRTKDYSASPGYAEVNKDFVRVANDPSVLSAFIASAFTGEYFKENERTAAYADGRPYYANKRPWWQEANAVGKLYLGALSTDINTGAISAVLQTPIKNEQGTLIGVGGVDLQLDQIQQMIEGISFRQQGFGFLLDSDLKVVHLAEQSGHNLSITDDGGKQKDGLEGLERDFADTEGFNALNQLMLSQEQGFSKVTFKGEDFYVVFNRIELEKPLVKWNVGLMLPAEIIDQPVSNAVQATALSVIAMLVVILFVIYTAVSIIVKPIRSLIKV